MKVIITKIKGKHADNFQLNEIHLTGPIDTMACGLVNEDYGTENTNKPITCIICLSYLEWAKKVSKLNNQ